MALVVPAENVTGDISKDSEKDFHLLVFAGLRDIQEKSGEDFRERIKLLVNSFIKTRESVIGNDSEGQVIAETRDCSVGFYGQLLGKKFWSSCI